MNYAVSYIYDTGDNATYLYATYEKALHAKQEAVHDCIQELCDDMGYVLTNYDTTDDTTINYRDEYDIKRYTRIIISRIFQ